MEKRRSKTLGDTAMGGTARSMTSRERVLVALDHREPDRVPIEFGSSQVSSVLIGQPYGYEALCEHLGISDYPRPEINVYLNSVKNVDARIMQRFGADLRWVMPGGPEVERAPDGTMVDAWGLVLTPSGAFNTFVDAKAPLRGADTPGDIGSYAHWPDLADPRITAGKRDEARGHHDDGFAVVASLGPGGRLFHTYAWLRGFDTWLMDMYENPSLYHALAERVLEVSIGYVETVLPAVAEFADIVYMADDLGTQRSTLMSRDAYLTFCKPYHKRWIEAVRRVAPRAKILMHSCGAISALIPDLIEIGVDILNPVQPKATGMDPLRVKREFGADLSFLGGLDIQELLPFGSPGEIRDGVRELLEAYAPDGGYVFAPAHEILPEVRPANIVAMFDAALEFGRYSGGVAQD
jgi:uroporphyrinogen decarboxylase